MVESPAAHQRVIPGGEETGEMNKKIVCWIGDAPNHRALVAKIAAHHEVAGIVIDKKIKKGPALTGGGWWKKLIDKIRFSKIDLAWKKMQQYYRTHFPALPAVPTITVHSINMPEVVEFTKELAPALIVVSGTSLIKEPLVSMTVPIGIMNLHTGLSPYVKGGPNCTNWCIANGQWTLIGNTVFWLSAGIDSGRLPTEWLVGTATSIGNSSRKAKIGRRVYRTREAEFN